MEPVIEQAAKAVASDVLKEAGAELSGRSKRKWAVVLLAFVLGAVVAVVVMKARQGSTVHGPAVGMATESDSETLS